MDAEEIILQIRENVQIFSHVPLQDGFSDEILVRDGTRILPFVNRAYTDLVKKGIYQCWHQLIMTVNRPNYKLSGNFTLVHDWYIKDADGVGTRTYDLIPEEITRREGEQYSRVTMTGRPERFAFSGNTVFFDKLPDYAYRVYFLADTIPALMTARTDTPTALDAQLHYALVAGGSYYIGRAALNKPGALQGHYIRFSELKAEWDKWQKDVMEVTESRVVAASVGPMTNKFMGYRTRSNYRR